MPILSLCQGTKTQVTQKGNAVPLITNAYLIPNSNHLNLQVLRSVIDDISYTVHKNHVSLLFLKL